MIREISSRNIHCGDVVGAEATWHDIKGIAL